MAVALQATTKKRCMNMFVQCVKDRELSVKMNKLVLCLVLLFCNPASACNDEYSCALELSTERANTQIEIDDQSRAMRNEMLNQQWEVEQQQRQLNDMQQQIEEQRNALSGGGY